MIDREKVIKGLQCIVDGTVRCECCGYAIDKHGHNSCQQNCASEAIAMLKEQEDLGEELTNAVELIRKKNKRIEELLKEQEIGHWVVLENCSNAGVYCSECHRKIFDHYPMRKQLSYFCPHCGTRMEGQEVK